MFLLFLGKPAGCLPYSELPKAHYHTWGTARETSVAKNTLVDEQWILLDGADC